MMVNVSRFVPVQQAVRDFLSLREKKIREAVRANYAMPESVSSSNVYMQRLKQAFDDEYAAAGFSWAEVKGASRIYIGAVAEDSSGYPDCRPEFYEAFQRAIDAGTRPETHVRVRTPVIRMRKSEIIQRGLELGAPLRLTWSCYRAEEAACGTCDSCALRLRAFREAGVADPVPYA